MKRKRCLICLHKMKKTKPHVCTKDSKGKVIVATLINKGVMEK